MKITMMMKMMIFDKFIKKNRKVFINLKEKKIKNFKIITK